MNVVKSPQSITPAYNPVIYQFASDFANILFFNVEVRDYTSNTLIVSDKAYITPVNLTGTDYDFSDIARNLVKWQLRNNQSVMQPIIQSVRDVYLKVTEVGLVGVTMSQLGPTYSLNPVRVWNADLNRVNFSTYQWNDYLMSNASTNTPFLTEKPNYYKLNAKSREFLYYLKTNSVDLNLDIRKYNKAGSLVDLKQFTFSSSAGMMRLDISPKLINATYAGFYQNGFKYQVSLSFSGARRSQVKWYLYEDPVDCSLELVNVLWENHLGGIDCYQFIQPVEERSVDRAIIENYPYGYDATTGIFTDVSNSVFAQNEKIINVNLNSQFTCWTKELTNDENNWIAGLLSSRNVWVELNDSRIYPVALVETNYRINKKQYERLNVLQSQWTFRVINEYIDNPDILAGTSVTGVDSTSTTTTTTTSGSGTTTTTTTGSGTTTTTTTQATTTTTSTTTTSTTYYEFPGSGYGGSTSGACNDATTNSRDLYSNCATINTGCAIYTTDTGTLLTGYTHIRIDGVSWRIGSASGLIQSIDTTQC
jgi:hypothetical protein